MDYLEDMDISSGTISESSDMDIGDSDNDLYEPLSQSSDLLPVLSIHNDTQVDQIDQIASSLDATERNRIFSSTAESWRRQEKPLVNDKIEQSSEETYEFEASDNMEVHDIVKKYYFPFEAKQKHKHSKIETVPKTRNTNPQPSPQATLLSKRKEEIDLLKKKIAEREETYRLLLKRSAQTSASPVKPTEKQVNDTNPNVTSTETEPKKAAEAVSTTSAIPMKVSSPIVYPISQVELPELDSVEEIALESEPVIEPSVAMEIVEKDALETEIPLPLQLLEPDNQISSSVFKKDLDTETESYSEIIAADDKVDEDTSSVSNEHETITNDQSELNDSEQDSDFEFFTPPGSPLRHESDDIEDHISQLEQQIKRYNEKLEQINHEKRQAELDVLGIQVRMSIDRNRKNQYQKREMKPLAATVVEPPRQRMHSTVSSDNPEKTSRRTKRFARAAPYSKPPFYVSKDSNLDTANKMGNQEEEDEGLLLEKHLKATAEHSAQIAKAKQAVQSKASEPLPPLHFNPLLTGASLTQLPPSKLPPSNDTNLSLGFSLPSIHRSLAFPPSTTGYLSMSSSQPLPPTSLTTMAPPLPSNTSTYSTPIHVFNPRMAPTQANRAPKASNLLPNSSSPRPRSFTHLDGYYP